MVGGHKYFNIVKIIEPCIFSSCKKFQKVVKLIAYFFTYLASSGHETLDLWVYNH
jgi:hypothetical protein